MKTGEILKTIRENIGINQTDAAVAIEITQPYLSEIESGRKPATLEMIHRICDYYEVPAEIVIVATLTPDRVPKSKKKEYKNLMLIINSWLSI